MMIDLLGFVLSLAVSLFEAICLNIFMGTFMERRCFRDKKVNSAIIVMGFWVGSRFGAELPLPSSLKVLAMVASYVLVSLVFFRSRMVARVVVSAVFSFMLYASDLLVISILVGAFSSSYAGMLDSPFQLTLAIIISRSVQYILTITINRFWAHRKLQKADSGYSWLLMIFPPAIAAISTGAFMICLTDSLSPLQLGLVTLSAIGLMFLGVIMVSLMNAMVDRQRKMRENALLKQKVEIEMESVAALSDSIHNQRKMMHDYDNHINTIKQLLLNSQYAKANDYLSRMSDAIDTFSYRVRTGNDILDAILNQKDFAAKSKGVAIHFATGKLADLPMESDDLVTVIANALDNAIEAVHRLDEDRRYIHVKLAYDHAQFIFSVINPVGRRVDIAGNTVETTKADRGMHGFGLNNIRTTLEKYDAGFELFCDDEQFQFTAIVTFPAAA